MPRKTEREDSQIPYPSSYKKRFRPAWMLAGTIFFMSHSRGAFPRPRFLDALPV